MCVCLLLCDGSIRCQPRGHSASVCVFVMDQYSANLEVTVLMCVFVSVIVMVKYGKNPETTALVFLCKCVCVFVCDCLIWSQPGCHSTVLCMYLYVCLCACVLVCVFMMVQYGGNLEATALVCMYLCVCL